MDSIRKRMVARRLMLMEERASWLSHWQQINRMVSPRQGRFLGSKTNDGKKKHGSIFDETATFASRTLGSGMMAGKSSPGRPWFALTTQDPDLAEFAGVKQWLHVVTNLMRDIFAKSNLYTILPTLYRELGDYGTAALFALEDDQSVVNFHHFTIGSYAIATDHRGRVDTIYRDFRMTVGQMVAKWGIDAVSDTVRNAYNRCDYDGWHDIVHGIEPNRDREDKADNKNLPFRSVYYEVSISEDKVLSESGYYEFPAMVPRWDVTGEDYYGSSPGMDALGSVLSLQIDQKRKHEAIDKLVNPPMTGPTSLRDPSINSGDVTYVDVTTGQGGFQPAYIINPQLPALLEDIQDIRQRIKTAYYEDVFLMLSGSDRRQITAREVDERHEEKLMMLGPVSERLDTELFNSLIDRTFNIMMRQGKLPEAPIELQGSPLKIDYVSLLSQAIKLVAASSIERFSGFVAGLAGVNPEALDKVDFDQTIDEYGQSIGVPPRIIVSDDDVIVRRQARAQKQQAMQAAQMAMTAAEGAKTLASADMSGDNALTRVAEAANG